MQYLAKRNRPTGAVWNVCRFRLTRNKRRHGRTTIVLPTRLFTDEKWHRTALTATRGREKLSPIRSILSIRRRPTFLSNRVAFVWTPSQCPRRPVRALRGLVCSDPCSHQPSAKLLGTSYILSIVYDLRLIVKSRGLSPRTRCRLRCPSIVPKWCSPTNSIVRELGRPRRMRPDRWSSNIVGNYGLILPNRF